MNRVHLSHTKELPMDLISIFNSIRDIPFRIPLSLEDKSIDCLTKHKMLFDALTNAGHKARFRICSFLWSDQKIPKEILAIPHDDKCEHLYLEISLNNEWITLDATWDQKLKNIMPTSEWDGKTNTKLAVTPIEIYPPDEGREVVHSASEEAFLEDIRKSGKFYEALNNWLEENR